jgi:hypothetical protein
VKTEVHTESFHFSIEKLSRLAPLSTRSRITILSMVVIEGHRYPRVADESPNAHRVDDLPSAAFAPVRVESFRKTSVAVTSANRA